MNLILLTNVLHNVLLTVAVAIVLAGIIAAAVLLNKLGEKLKTWMSIVIYIVTFMSLIAAALFLLWLWNFDLGSYFGDWGTNIAGALENSVGELVSSIIVIFIALFLVRIVKLTTNRIGTKASAMQKRKKTFAKLLQSILRYTIWIITILVILAIWGVNIGPALAGLGILGLVIGLGAQKFINDLINGLFIIFEHHYDVGDVIETNGFKGEVIDIGLKTTRIKNWKGEVKILANGDITDLVNSSKYESIAIVDFGISYNSDIQKTTDVLNAALPELRKQLPEMIDTPQLLGVMELADSSVNMRVIAKTLSNQQYNVERVMRAFIKRTLDANQIEIPFPQVVIHEVKD